MEDSGGGSRIFGGGGLTVMHGHGKGEGAGVVRVCGNICHGIICYCLPLQVQ